LLNALALVTMRWIVGCSSRESADTQREGPSLRGKLVIWVWSRNGLGAKDFSNSSDCKDKRRIGTSGSQSFRMLPVRNTRHQHVLYMEPRSVVTFTFSSALHSPPLLVPVSYPSLSLLYLISWWVLSVITAILYVCIYANSAAVWPAGTLKLFTCGVYKLHNGSHLARSPTGQQISTSRFLLRGRARWGFAPNNLRSFRVE